MKTIEETLYKMGQRIIAESIEFGNVGERDIAVMQTFLDKLVVKLNDNQNNKSYREEGKFSI